MRAARTSPATSPDCRGGAGIEETDGGRRNATRPLGRHHHHSGRARCCTARPRGRGAAGRASAGPGLAALGPRLGLGDSPQRTAPPTAREAATAPFSAESDLAEPRSRRNSSGRLRLGVGWGFSHIPYLSGAALSRGGEPGEPGERPRSAPRPPGAGPREPRWRPRTVSWLHVTYVIQKYLMFLGWH